MFVLYILIAVIGLCASPYIYLFLGKITRPLSALFIACAEVFRGRPEDLFPHTNREIFAYTYYEAMDVLNNENDKFPKFAWPLIRLFHFGGLLFFAIARLRIVILITAIAIGRPFKKAFRRIRK